MKEDLEKIFDDEFNAYSEVNHGVNVLESMPCMNKEKFVEIVSKLLSRDEYVK